MKKKSLTLTMIGIIVLVIAIVISLVFVFNQKDTKAYNSKLEQAQKYVSKVDYKKAEAAYLEAIKIDPKQTKAYVKLADVYMDNGKEDKAVAILNKAYKNVESTADKKEIKDKQKKIQEKIKNGESVINNGGDYVTYKGKSYYWQYNTESYYADDSHDVGLGNYLQFCNVDNDLVCVDEKGKKKTIYTGKGKGGIWIFDNRIYIERTDPDESSYLSLDLDGSNEKEEYFTNIGGVTKEGLVAARGEQIEVLKKGGKSEQIAFFHFNDPKVLYVSDSRVYYYIINDSVSGIDFGCVDLDGNNKVTLKTLNLNSWCDWWDDEEYEMKDPIVITCVQEIGDEVYFQFGGFDGSGNVYQGGKIAKIKTDGTGYTELEDIDDDGYITFTAYKNGSTVDLKMGGELNKPFYDGNSVSVYKEDGTKKELLTNDEISKYGTAVCSLNYTGDELYFVAVETDENFTRCNSYTYCKKDLKTNKITVYQSIDVN